MGALKTGYDVVIIGAGPAGLAAGAALVQAGADVIVVDRGPEIARRGHGRAEDLGEGVGGAGLFSDGKFSFYPSGTQLYGLDDPFRLRRAYEWCCAMLASVGIKSIPYPEHSAEFQYQDVAVKEYPSYYGSLVERRRLIELLGDALEGAIETRTSLVTLERSDEGYRLELQRRGEPWRIEARSVVLATGRLGSLGSALRGSSLIPRKALRYEMGIRIESRYDSTFLARCAAADVKRLQKLDGVEFRTFCTCRRGEVWNIPYGAYSALSGRSDGPPTNFSNFGFLARYTGARLDDGRTAWRGIESRVRGGNAVYQPLGEFLGESRASEVTAAERPWFPKASFERGNITEILGPMLGAAMRRGLRELVEWAPELDDPSTVCLFPAIEGVGEFPELDNQLRVPGERIWCVGDLVGTMRGLVPCIVNGYYVGLGIQDG